MDQICRSRAQGPNDTHYVKTSGRNRQSAERPHRALRASFAQSRGRESSGRRSQAVKEVSTSLKPLGLEEISFAISVSNVHHNLFDVQQDRLTNVEESIRDIFRLPIADHGGQNLILFTAHSRDISAVF